MVGVTLQAAIGGGAGIVLIILVSQFSFQPFADPDTFGAALQKVRTDSARSVLDPHDNLSIRMSRDCDIRNPVCPAYTMELFSNGNVILVPYRHLGIYGTQFLNIETTDFREIVDKLNEIDYLSLQSQHDTQTDGTSVYTSVHDDGSLKHSYYYSGAPAEGMEQIVRFVEDKTGITSLIERGAKDREGLVMSLERLGGALGGPLYFVTIYGNGTVVYHGEAFVAVNGTRISQISVEDSQKMRDMFYDSEYFAMKDVYDCDYSTFRDCYTDGLHSLTSISEGGKTKSVYLYHGYLRSPEGLFELERAFEDLAGTRTWSDCPVGQWPSYESGCTSK